LTGAVPGDKATLGWPFSLAFNHLLEAEPAARERLAPFAGASIELRAPPLPALTFTILPGGRVQAERAGGEEPALVVTLKPGFPAALAKGEDYLMRELEVRGDPRLAGEVMWLVRHLREALPDIAEEDLSRVMGDVAARRLAQGARELFAWQADAARRLGESFADYLTEEKRLLVGRAEHAAFADALARLRDALERLEKRAGRLG
jgi:ubiquinone biosynthesis accessory factor UbiJ